MRLNWTDQWIKKELLSCCSPHRWCHPGEDQAAPGQYSSCFLLFQFLSTSQFITHMWRETRETFFQATKERTKKAFIFYTSFRRDSILGSLCSKWRCNDGMDKGSKGTSIVAACEESFQNKTVWFGLLVLRQAHPSSSACDWAVSWRSCPGWGAGLDWSAISSECSQSVWDQESWTAESWGMAVAAGSPLTPSSRQSQDSSLKHMTEFFCLIMSNSLKSPTSDVINRQQITFPSKLLCC